MISVCFSCWPSKDRNVPAMTKQLHYLERQVVAICSDHSLNWTVKVQLHYVHCVRFSFKLGRSALIVSDIKETTKCSCRSTAFNVFGLHYTFTMYSVVTQENLSLVSEMRKLPLVLQHLPPWCWCIHPSITHRPVTVKKLSIFYKSCNINIPMHPQRSFTTRTCSLQEGTIFSRVCPSGNGG